jgi:RNA polymerase sigma-70 factor (sigma-E family)
MPMRLSLSKRSRYEEFVAANGDGLVKLAYALCGDRGRAEDAVQEALIRVYQRWSRLTDPLAYARRTAINATRADWRRLMRADRAYREAARLPSTDTDDPQERFLTNRALIDALKELPHGQRAVIVLRYGCQLSEAETAATLEITTGTVKSQTARALVRMRETLTPPKPAAYELESA